MKHERMPAPGGWLYGFTTDRGSVWIRVEERVLKFPSLSVYEQQAAMSAIGKPDEEFRDSPEAAAARNKFGPSAIRKMLRVVRNDFPDIEFWLVDPAVRRHNTGQRFVRSRD